MGFSTFDGFLGNSGFVYFCLLFFMLQISGFSPFSRIFRSGWFLLGLVSRFGGQPFILLNLLTIDLFLLPPHTTAHLPPNHTLPHHNHALPPFTPDLTPDPVMDMGGHGWCNTRTDQKHVEDKQTRARVPSDGGGVQQTTRARVTRGEGGHTTCACK